MEVSICIQLRSFELASTGYPEAWSVKLASTGFPEAWLIHGTFHMRNVHTTSWYARHDIQVIESSLKIMAEWCLFLL